MQASDHVTLLVACGMLSIEDVVSATSVLMHSWPSMAGRRKNNWDGVAGNSFMNMFLGLPLIFDAVRSLPSSCVAWRCHTLGNAVADATCCCTVNRLRYLETGIPGPFL